MRSTLKIIRKYWPAIIGSFILAVTWYFEKVRITKLNDQLKKLEHLKDQYTQSNNIQSITFLLTDLAKFNYQNDSILAKSSLVSAYSVEIMRDEQLKNTGKSINLYSKEETKELFYEYYKTMDKLKLMESNEDIKGLEEWHKKNRSIIYDLTKFDGLNIDYEVAVLNEKNEQTYLFTLIFYVIGILFLTFSKVKEVLLGQKYEESHLVLLKEIKEQNIKLLHRKERN